MSRKEGGIRNLFAHCLGKIEVMAIAYSKLTTQGQISVPTEVRRQLGISPGSILEWDEVRMRTLVRGSRASAWTAGLTSQTLGMTPRAAGNTSRAFGMTSRAFGMTPRALGVTLRTLGMAPRTLGMTPQTLGMASRTLGMASRFLGMTSRTPGNPSRAAGKSPEKAQNAPEEAAEHLWWRHYALVGPNIAPPMPPPPQSAAPESAPGRPALPTHNSCCMLPTWPLSPYRYPLTRTS